MTSEQLLEKGELDLRETVCCSSIGQKEEKRILLPGQEVNSLTVFILLSSIMFSYQGDNCKMSYYFPTLPQNKNSAMKIIYIISWQISSSHLPAATQCLHISRQDNELRLFESPVTVLSFFFMPFFFGMMAADADVRRDGNLD